MKTVNIIQARMTSTRLPGKILKPVFEKPLLLYLLERMKRSKECQATVVATTVNRQDDPVEKLCRESETDIYRGSETDVLARYYEAAKLFKADRIVRVTADCPLLDPAIVDLFVGAFEEGKKEKIDYLTSALGAYPRGMSCEVFSFEALERCFKNAHTPSEREHVTLHMYSAKDGFEIRWMEELRSGWAKYRWTVDTPEDFELIRRVLFVLYEENPKFTFDDCIRVMEENPDWYEINRNIAQKNP